jgi:hypothetical protein
MLLCYIFILLATLLDILQQFAICIYRKGIKLPDVAQSMAQINHFVVCSRKLVIATGQRIVAFTDNRCRVT